MSTLGHGVEYHEFQWNAIGARVYVARIDPSQGSFAVGPLSNDPSIEDKAKPLVYRRRQMLTLESKVDYLKRVLINTNYTDKSMSDVLRPVWISNGTFFGVHSRSDQYAFGPAVHRGLPVTDVTPVITNGSVPKSERWLIAQPKERKYSEVNIFQNKPRKPVVGNLDGTEQEVLGGAGILISNGTPKTNNFWRSDVGGKFDSGQPKTTGPIFAICGGVKPIYYAICVREGSGKPRISWSETASYLMAQFRVDLANTRKKVQDKQIQEACVFDGGTSRQLWVSNPPRGDKLRFTGLEVPNYLCIWAKKI